MAVVIVFKLSVPIVVRKYSVLWRNVEYLNRYPVGILYIFWVLNLFYIFYSSLKSLKSIMLCTFIRYRKIKMLLKINWKNLLPKFLRWVWLFYFFKALKPKQNCLYQLVMRSIVENIEVIWNVINFLSERIRNKKTTCAQKWHEFSTN